MTDELEALLEEEEEEEPAFPLLRGAWAVRKKTAQAGGEEGSSDGETAEPEAQAARRGEGPDDGAAAARGVAPVWEETGFGSFRRGLAPFQKKRGVPDAPDRVVAEKKPPEAALYESMTRTRQAAGYRRERGAVWLPLEKAAPLAGGVQGVDATALDRVFQRDARRYDGGFTWQ